MPNWCEGFLKIRGNMQNIKKFLLESLIAYDWGKHTNFEEIPRNDGVILNSEYEGEEINIAINRECHITGTTRAFAQEGFVTISNREGKDTITTIHIRQAWDMIAEEFAKLSKKYDVDFRLFGYERDQQFSRDIIIEKGLAKSDLTQQYDDWEWDCPNSELGD